MPKHRTQKRRTQKRRTRRGGTGTGKGQSTRYNIIVPQGEKITESQLDRKYPITGPSTVAPEGVSKSSPKSKFSATRWFRSRNYSRKVTPM